MKSCTCYALRAVDCTCLPAKYDEIYEIYTTPEQEPVAWLHTKIEGVAVPHRPADLDKHPDRWEALYKTPPSCPTCKALSRTVMLDQTSHDTTPLQRKPLTDEEIWNSDSIMEANSGYGASFETLREIVRAIEAAHGITGENT
jgi:hypothetical protein